MVGLVMHNCFKYLCADCRWSVSGGGLPMIIFLNPSRIVSVISALGASVGAGDSGLSQVASDNRRGRPKVLNYPPRKLSCYSIL
jgi:hypothetical protein